MQHYQVWGVYMFADLEAAILHGMQLTRTAS